MVIGGDFNASIYVGNTHLVNVYKTRLFEDFVMRNHLGALVLISLYPAQITLLF